MTDTGEGQGSLWRNGARTDLLQREPPSPGRGEGRPWGLPAAVKGGLQGSSAQPADSPAPREQKDPKDTAGIRAPAQPTLHLPTHSEPGGALRIQICFVSCLTCDPHPLASTGGWTCGCCQGHSRMSESGARAMVLHLAVKQSEW